MRTLRGVGKERSVMIGIQKGAAMTLKTQVDVQKLINVTSDIPLMCVFNGGMRISVPEADYADSGIRLHPPSTTIF